MRKLSLILFLTLLPSVALTAPTRFESPAYGIESVTFGGTGSLRSASASIPPAILDGPAVGSVTEGSATVRFTTDKLTSGAVYVGTSPSTYTQQGSDGVSADRSVHAVGLPFLKKGTTYYAKVRAVDAAGNAVESAPFTFTTDPGDVRPPQFLSGPSLAQNSASRVTVTWTTDEVSSSTVEYGTASTAEDSAGKADELTTFHQVSVTVVPSRSYVLRARSRDASGNAATSPELALSTIATPSITDVSITDVTLTSAVVLWKTSVPASTRVAYAAGGAQPALVNEDAPVTAHAVRLSGLATGSEYKLRLSGTDGAGNVLNSDEYAFRTVVLPAITGLRVESVDSRGVTVRWESSSPIDTFLRYSLTASEDRALLGKQGATGDDKLITAHTVKLDDLESDVEYTLSASGKDVFGNQAPPPSLTFSTLADHDPPAIESLRSDTTVDLGSRSTVQVLVSFGLSEPGRTVLEYGPGATGEYPKTVETDGEVSRTKFLVIPGLTPGESYHFRVRATDRAGNVTVSPDYLVLAPVQSPSLYDLIFGRIRSNFGWLGRL